MRVGDALTLVVERPAAGGRMIARHDGGVVLVAGAIPGETVRAEVERVQRGTVWAATREVVEASPDRVTGAPDGACGGRVFAHVAYPRQLALKAAIIEDAFRRLGRIHLEAPIEVVPSPVEGYRMRARLHVRGGRAGFFREGTHDLCEAGPTRQLRPEAVDAVERLARGLGSFERAPVAAIELTESVDGSTRACHLELLPDADPSRLAAATSVDGIAGVTCAPRDHPRTIALWGTPVVTDRLDVDGAEFSLARGPRAFFQGNRFLLRPLVARVLDHVAPGPLVDLYAGVGLFAVAAAVRGIGEVEAVEGDAHAAADLRENARQCPGTLRVRAEAVEGYLARRRKAAPATAIVDPPRTGLSRAALAGALALGAPRLVYVSCDVATLARDAAAMVGAGYAITAVSAFDLFPVTAHVETLIAFSR